MRAPQSAQLYREAVRNLNTTRKPVERQDARVLIAELLGGHRQATDSCLTQGGPLSTATRAPARKPMPAPSN